MNEVKARINDYRERVLAAKLAAERSLKQRENQQIADAQASTEAAAKRSMTAIQAAIASQVEPRQRALIEANDLFASIADCQAAIPAMA